MKELTKREWDDIFFADNTTSIINEPFRSEDCWVIPHSRIHVHSIQVRNYLHMNDTELALIAFVSTGLNLTINRALIIMYQDNELNIIPAFCSTVANKTSKIFITGKGS